MKNHEEMTASVFRRMAEYEAARKKRSTIRNRALALAVCCCLVALVCISVGQNGLIPTAPPPIGITEPTEQTGTPTPPPTGAEVTLSPAPTNTADPTTAPSISEPTNDFCQIFCTLHRNPLPVDTAGSKLYYDPALYTEEQRNPTDLAAYLGFDLTKLDLGYACTPGSNCPLIRNSEGTIVYDTIGYWYEEIDMMVHLSKIGSPYDCVYHTPQDHPSQFYLGSGETVEAFLYTDNGSHFVIDFELRDIHFRITSDGFDNETDFSMVVRRIIEFVAA